MHDDKPKSPLEKLEAQRRAAAWPAFKEYLALRPDLSMFRDADAEPVLKLAFELGYRHVPMFRHDSPGAVWEDFEQAGFDYLRDKNFKEDEIEDLLTLLIGGAEECCEQIHDSPTRFGDKKPRLSFATRDARGHYHYPRGFEIGGKKVGGHIILGHASPKRLEQENEEDETVANALSLLMQSDNAAMYREFVSADFPGYAEEILRYLGGAGLSDKVNNFYALAAQQIEAQYPDLVFDTEGLPLTQAFPYNDETKTEESVARIIGESGKLNDQLKITVLGHVAHQWYVKLAVELLQERYGPFARVRSGDELGNTFNDEAHEVVQAISQALGSVANKDVREKAIWMLEERMENFALDLRAHVQRLDNRAQGQSR